MCVEAMRAYTKRCKRNGSVVLEVHDRFEYLKEDSIVYKVFKKGIDKGLCAIVLGTNSIDKNGFLVRNSHSSKSTSPKRKNIPFTKRFSFQCWYTVEEAIKFASGMYGSFWEEKAVIKAIFVRRGTRIVRGVAKQSTCLTDGLPALRIENGQVLDMEVK